jgi:hypothetical protein
MKIFLISYLAIGILSNFIGPSARKLNSVIKETRSATITRLINKPKVKKREDLFIEVILRILTIFFFPILYIALVVEFFRFSYTPPWLKKILNDPRLYYWRMGGFGTIRCLECDFKQDIVSFLHGIDSCETGYQCQRCGKFHALVENDMHPDANKQCNCGGDLDRGKPIFCPSCKTTHVTYILKYIT